LIVAGIPAFNEERTIAQVVLETLTHVDKVVVVDDGSKDMTGEIAEKLGALVIKHERNMGKGEAFRSIFKAARELGADILVTLDADGQHDPRQIPSVIKPVEDGAADIAVGSRYVEGLKAGDMPAYRRIGLEAIDSFTRRALHLRVRDTQSGFRAYSKTAIWRLLPTERNIAVDSELLLRAAREGLSFAEVPVTVAYKGLERTSKHNPIYHSLQIISGVLKFISIKHPLIFYGLPGVAFVALGVIFGLRAAEIYRATQGQYFSVGFTLLSAVFIISGLLLFFVAIILFTLITALREQR